MNTRILARSLAFLALLVLLPASAQAWWNADWKYRKKIVLNTSPTGADTKESAGPVTIAIRLHTGNFLFTDARPDGSDIRFVAGDDKTPLKQHVERFDSANQLAIIWVQLPRVAGASSAEYLWMYSGNDKVTSAGDDAKGVYDPQRLVAIEFGEAQPPFKDLTGYANTVSGDGVAPDAAGLFAGAGAFSGSPLKVTPGPGARVAAGGALTVSAWIRPAEAQKAHLFSWGPVSIDLDGERVVARVDKVQVAGGALKAGQWTSVGLALSDQAVLYVGGQPVGSDKASLKDVSGDIVVGDGFKGSMDSIAVESAAEPAAWFGLVAAQGEDGKLLTYAESEAGEEAGSSYIKILFSSLTVDAKVVIAILAVMFLIAVSVMVSKAVQVSRTDLHNVRFLDRFNARPAEFLNPGSAPQGAAGELGHSSLVRLYDTGMRELRQRVGASAQHALSAESVAAIRASIDSTLIRENQRLNRLMVLLTIAISGGPFLGLLGTVVGVMITFASIAAQGDVNINAIAPGIAAALLATVAGLTVAIPSLFGYNYLITRIKGITADMQAFSDEFICKMAEAQSR